MITKRTRKSFIAFGGAAIALTLTATPALAEGSFTSSISGAYSGFNSRNWTDMQLDNDATSVKWQGCTKPGGVISLWANAGIFPDYHVGNRTNTCNTSYWSGGPSNLSQDDFHWKIESISGGGPISVSTVTTEY